MLSACAIKKVGGGSESRAVIGLLLYVDTIKINTALLAFTSAAFPTI